MQPKITEETRALELIWIAAEQVRRGCNTAQVLHRLSTVQYILNETLPCRAQYLAVAGYIRALMGQDDKAQGYARSARGALSMCSSDPSKDMSRTDAYIDIAENYGTLRTQLNAATALRDELNQPRLDPFDKGQIAIRISFLIAQVEKYLLHRGQFLPNKVKECASKLRSEFPLASRALVQVD